MQKQKWDKIEQIDLRKERQVTRGCSYPISECSIRAWVQHRVQSYCCKWHRQCYGQVTEGYQLPCPASASVWTGCLPIGISVISFSKGTVLFLTPSQSAVWSWQLSSTQCQVLFRDSSVYIEVFSGAFRLHRACKCHILSHQANVMKPSEKSRERLKQEWNQ